MSRCLVLFLVALPAFAQPARTHDITLEDYGTLATIRELAVSPDGLFVAYTEARWDKGDDLQKTDLWVARLSPENRSAQAIRLTGDRANDRRIRWSPQGGFIYFLGNRKRAGETEPPYDGSTQVWIVEVANGQLKPITRVKGGVSSYDYSFRDDAVYYTVDVTVNDDDPFAKFRATHKAEYGHGTRKVSELYKLDFASWRTQKLIAEKRYIREFVVDTERRIAMVTAADDSVIRSEGESRVDFWEKGKLVTPPTDSYRKNAPSPHAWLENLTPPKGDGKNVYFAFCAVFDAYPAEIVFANRDGDGVWTTKLVKRSNGFQVCGYGSPLNLDGPRLIAFGERHGKVGLARSNPMNPERHVEFSEGFEENKELGRVLHAFAEAGSTHLSVVGGDDFATLWATVGTNRNSFKCLLHQNPQTANWLLPTVQHVTWKAPDGAEVGGVLELPPNYKKGDKLPLVVGIHGGPTTSTKAELSYDPHNGRLYFAAHGYAVLFPNYRGSTGYGDKFVTDLIGRENDIEVKDILAGIQHLIKQGIADPDRIGVMGWSNGGYLTNCLITLKDSPVKFKAASSGAGIMDTNAQWGMNDEPAYMAVFKKGLPWEKPDEYRKASPLYGLGNVTTPTLIHVGGNDERCPPGHSKMLYRALKEYRKVPTELIVYPNQPHGLTKLSNRIAKMEWDLAWFDKYVKGNK